MMCCGSTQERLVSDGERGRAARQGGCVHVDGARMHACWPPIVAMGRCLVAVPRGSAPLPALPLTLDLALHLPCNYPAPTLHQVHSALQGSAGRHSCGAAGSSGGGAGGSSGGSGDGADREPGCLREEGHRKRPLLPLACRVADSADCFEEAHGGTLRRALRGGSSRWAAPPGPRRPKRCPKPVPHSAPQRPTAGPRAEPPVLEGSNISGRSLQACRRGGSSRASIDLALPRSGWTHGERDTLCCLPGALRSAGRCAERGTSRRPIHGRVSAVWRCRRRVALRRRESRSVHAVHGIACGLALPGLRGAQSLALCFMRSSADVLK